MLFSNSMAKKRTLYCVTRSRFISVRIEYYKKLEIQGRKWNEAERRLEMARTNVHQLAKQVNPSRKTGSIHFT